MTPHCTRPCEQLPATFPRTGLTVSHANGGRHSAWKKTLAVATLPRIATSGTVSFMAKYIFFYFNGHYKIGE